MVTAAWILSAIRQNPLIFNGITGGFLCASSDAMAQQLEQRQQQQQQQPPYLGSTTKDEKSSSAYLASSPLASFLSSSPPHHATMDWFRCCSAGIIGMFFGGVVYPHAYAKLDAIWVGTKFVTVFKKSIVEIATVGIFVNSLSMASRGMCRFDTPPDQIVQHVAQELPTVTKNDICVWLPYNLLAFSVIPAVIRPTTTAFMEASWQTYISLRSHDYD